MKKIITLMIAILMIFGATFVADAGNYILGYNNIEKSTAKNYIFSVHSSKIHTANKVVQAKPIEPKVVSLMYHKISEKPSELGAFCVSPETFEKDIVWLKENGYKFCFASEVDKIFEQDKSGGKYAVITFDDGYESDYKYAMPILEKHGAKATFFIIGSQLGIEENITEEHLKLLAASESVELGSHSYELHTLPLEQIKRIYEVDDTIYLVADFKYNADLLQKMTGKEITTLSFPNGIWTNFAVSMLKSGGFTEFYTSDASLIKESGTPHGRINRYDGIALKDLLHNYLNN